MGKQLTDGELQAMAMYIARRYLEVERGLRDVQFLRRFLDPAVYARQRSHGTSRFGGGGIVRPTDIGQVDFRRTKPDHVEAVIVAREEGDHWGVLVMELRADERGRWRVSELTRAQDRKIAPALHAEPPQQDGQHEQAVEAARRTKAAWARRRQAAQEAFRSVTVEKPATDLQMGDVVLVCGPSDWAAVTDVDRNAQTAVQVRIADGRLLAAPPDRCIPTLDITGAHAEEIQRAATDAARQLIEAQRELDRWMQAVAAFEADQPEHLTRLLGGRPNQRSARQWWDQAADAIERYRRRWNVDDPHTTLGGVPAGHDQAVELEAAKRTLRRALKRLSGAREAPHDDGSKRADAAAVTDLPGQLSMQPWEAVKLPMEPLLEALPTRPEPAMPGLRGPIADAADMLNLTRRSVYRLKKTGLSPLVADRLATRAGLHPLLVWGTHWESASSLAPRHWSQARTVDRSAAPPSAN